MAGSLKSSETKPFNLRSIRGTDPEAAGNFRVNESALGDSVIGRPADSPVSSRSSSGSHARLREEVESVAEAADGERWEVRLGLGQLIILWSVIAGTMIMVFLFGLYAGREQGVQSALEGSADAAARLPIANAVPPSDVAPPTDVATGASDESSAEPVAGILKSLEQSPPATRPAGSDGSPETIAANDTANDTEKALQQIPDTQQSAAALTHETVEHVTPKAEAAPPLGTIDIATRKSDRAPLDDEIAALVGDESSSHQKGTTLADKAKSAESKEEKNAKAKAIELPLKTAEVEKPKPQQKPIEPAKVETAKADSGKGESVKTVKAGSQAPGWYLQVAAARTSQEANAVAKKLQVGGLKPTIETAEVNGSTYFRVVLGPYASKNAAAATRKSVEATKAAKGDPFLKQVR